jgi:hypothetical protein
VVRSPPSSRASPRVRRRSWFALYRASLGVWREVVGVHGVKTARAGEGVAKSARAGAHIGDAVAGRVDGGCGHNIKAGGLVCGRVLM